MSFLKLKKATADVAFLSGALGWLKSSVVLGRNG